MFFIPPLMFPGSSAMLVLSVGMKNVPTGKVAVHAPFFSASVVRARVPLPLGAYI